MSTVLIYESLKKKKTRRLTRDIERRTYGEKEKINFFKILGILPIIEIYCTVQQQKNKISSCRHCI